MKLSADPPPDGDFVRYIERLTAQPPSAKAPQAAPSRTTVAPPAAAVPAEAAVAVQRFVASVWPGLRRALGAWLLLLALGVAVPRLAWLQGPLLLGLLAWLAWRVWQDLAGGGSAVLRQRLLQWAESAKR